MYITYSVLFASVSDRSTNIFFYRKSYRLLSSIRNLFLFYKDEGILLVIPFVATVYMGLLFFFVTTNFFLCSFVDPGIYPRGQHTTAPLVYTNSFFLHTCTRVVGSSPTRGSSFFLGKVTVLGVPCCFALLFV